MHQPILILIFNFLVSLACAQHFSGEVVYKLSIIPNPGVDVDSILRQQPGTSSVYLITDKYYKSTYFRDGKEAYSYTYLDETKLMYDVDAGKPYVTYRDSRKPNNELVKSTIYKDSSAIILGYTCYMVEYIYKNYTAKTYYSDKVKINYESFHGHEVGNWYSTMKAVNGSLGLKTITTYDDHVEVHEVVEVKSRAVRRAEFDLPTDKPLYASFSVLESQVILKQPSEESITCYQSHLLKAPDLYGRTKTYTSYVRFVVSNTGAINYTSALDDDAYGLGKIAVEIINTCGLEFTPGLIRGKPQGSEVYFPVEFRL